MPFGVMGSDTLVGNPLRMFFVLVTRMFFSAGIEFSFFSTMMRVRFFGTRTMAASMTLKSGLKNIFVSEKVLKSFVVQ